jgi:bleomycin hydrolase
MKVKTKNGTSANTISKTKVRTTKATKATSIALVKHPLDKLLNNALMATNYIEQVLVNQNRVKQLVNQSQFLTHTIKNLPTISDQKQSGRCWMFAELFYYRTAMIRKYGLDPSFEFSTSFLFYHDKLEKFRHALLLLAEDDDLRASSPYTNPLYGAVITVSDGGWSGYLSNIIQKHGLIPKSAYGESPNTEKTRYLNDLLRRLLQVYCHRMRGTNDLAELQTLVDNGIIECKSILDYCLGVPPTSFTWQYHGTSDHAKSKEVKHWSSDFRRLYYESKEYTPLEFWKIVQNSCKYKLPSSPLIYDPLRQPGICISGVTESTNVHEMMGTRKYLTMDPETILQYARQVIRKGYPVPIACDVDCDVYYDTKIGIMDNGIIQYGEICPSLRDLDITERVASEIEETNHVMCLVGYNVINDTWKVANSWGTGCGYNGYWIATTQWLMTHMADYLIPLEFMSKEHQALINGEPTESYVYGDPVM